MLSNIKNKLLRKYTSHPEAVVISCFFNPQNSLYRLKAFNTWYDSIKHLNHRIVECVIGDAKPQLPENANIRRVYTQNLLWHKEALLNGIISDLPSEFKYVFWVDADVMFTNKDWLTDGVKQLQDRNINIIQPFEYCIHLEQDETKPSFDVETAKARAYHEYKGRRLWRSFCANIVNAHLTKYESETYNIHGHVGFAWAAKRTVLQTCPLYEKALIGGADHIIAHAAAGQIPHVCITKSFTDNIDEVNEWSRQFFWACDGRVKNGKYPVAPKPKIGYVTGDLYHLWHGDINKRQYLKRIQDFTPQTKNITQKDPNGLYITHKNDDHYIKNYFREREVSSSGSDGFLESMALGYMTDSTMAGGLLGGNFVGAALGSMLHGDSGSQQQFSDGGGGDFSGGGAGGQWNESPPVASQPSGDVQTASVAVIDDTVNTFS